MLYINAWKLTERIFLESGIILDQRRGRQEDSHELLVGILQSINSFAWYGIHILSYDKIHICPHKCSQYGTVSEQLKIGITREGVCLFY